MDKTMIYCDLEMITFDKEIIVVNKSIIISIIIHVKKIITTRKVTVKKIQMESYLQHSRILQEDRSITS